jgi:hypothetical protein
MRICFVGNSHLATAKFGWDAVAPDYRDVEVSFFGAIATVFADVAVEDGKLVPKSDAAKQSFIRTSGGRDSAIFTDYDLVILLALGFGLWNLLDLYDKYRWDDQNNTEGEYELVSTGYLHEIAKARLTRSTAIRFRNDIRKSGACVPKVWIYPEPMPSQSVLTEAPAQKSDLSALRLEALRRAVHWHDERSLGTAFAAARSFLSAAEDIVLEQPAHTITADVFTQREFSDGSIGLASLPSPRGDFVHMNGRFGELMVRQILNLAAG